MSYFVTGTDTNIGKTLIASALLHHFSAFGYKVVGMKPVAAGGFEDVQQLLAASNVTAPTECVNPYAFTLAVAPHLAAQQAHRTVELQRILSAFQSLSQLADHVIVEGVGGWRVPLNDTEDSADLAVKLGLPVILVVGVRLGCLNHALLTAEAIAARGLTLAGWVANCVERDMPLRDENIAALQRRLSAPLIGIVPFQPAPNARTIATRFNPF